MVAGPAPIGNWGPASTSAETSRAHPAWSRAVAPGPSSCGCRPYRFVQATMAPQGLTYPAACAGTPAADG